jgi:hypothetical protein
MFLSLRGFGVFFGVCWRTRQNFFPNKRERSSLLLLWHEQSTVFYIISVVTGRQGAGREIMSATEK